MKGEFLASNCQPNSAASSFMTVSNRSGKMKRNTEQTVLTLLAAIRSGVPVAVSCSGTEAEQPF